MRVIVVGAGLSGLMAAHELVRNGHDVAVFDKGRGVGGRLATRRIDDATLDHGAQFFTVRTDEFATHVKNWLDAGVVYEWCKGFADVDGHPRYVGSKGMSGVAKYLAQGLDVRLNTLVFSLTRTDTHFAVTLDDGVVHECDGLVLTAPIPQSFSLMFSAEMEMPTELRSIDYDRTLGLLAVLDSAHHNVPAPGGLQFPDDVFSFIGDNQAKGISEAPSLTFHTNPEWSLAHFERELDDVHALLTAAATPWLGEAKIVSSQPKKWRFATPKSTWPEPFWATPDNRLVLAGDAFAGPKMEGAALSGLAAARALHTSQ
jgi:predicted NAD/FAD-dependent oxidoreductase